METMNGRVLVMTKEELRNELAEWYANFIGQPDIIKDYLIEGNVHVSDILGRGLNQMSIKELIGIADGWADMEADMFSSDGDSLIGIVVEDVDQEQYIVARMESVEERLEEILDGPVKEPEEPDEIDI